MRLAGVVIVLWVVATIGFFALQAIPGDPSEALVGGPGSQASAEALEAARVEFGLDRPLPVQYVDYLARIARFDFGVSYSQRLPVTEVIGQSLAPTLTLALAAFVIAWVLAILGVIVGALGPGRRRLLSGAVSGIEMVTATLPGFWLASILIVIFSTGLGWLPPVSDGSLRGVILPALALAIPLAGYLGQVMRESAEDAITSPFALSARARGEGPLGLQLRHGLPHALLPGLTLSGWALGYLLSGAVAVELIFGRPGLGRSLLTAVTVRDVPLVLGVTLLSAVGYIVVTLLVDLLLAAIDPRLVTQRRPRTARLTGRTLEAVGEVER